MKEAINYSYNHRFARHCRCLGWTTYMDRQIQVDRKRHKRLGPFELINTMVHEDLHACFPEFDEREITAWADAITKSLTPQQEQKYFNLYDRKRTPNKR